MSIKNHLTVVPDDKLIIVDGQALVIEAGVALLSGHSGLHALQWHGLSGELEWENGNPNTMLEEGDWANNCEHYVTQFDAEVARKEAEAEQARIEHEEWYNSLEQRWIRLRSSRDAKIAETDYLMMVDYPITQACREAFQTYRQALRDITSLSGAPWDDNTIPWPVKPEVVKVEA